MREQDILMPEKTELRRAAGVSARFDTGLDQVHLVRS